MDPACLDIGTPSGDCADQACLEALDRALSALVRPDARWLSVDLGMAASAEMVARAPVEVLAVGHLAWPNRLGALLPDEDFGAAALRRRGVGLSREDGHIWLIFRGRAAEVPHAPKSLPPSRRETRLNA
jgi:hypothetical protein